MHSRGGSKASQRKKIKIAKHTYSVQQVGQVKFHKIAVTSIRRQTNNSEYARETAIARIRIFRRQYGGWLFHQDFSQRVYVKLELAHRGDR